MGIGENVGENVGENTGTSGGDSGYTPPSGTKYISWDAESTTYSTYLGPETITSFISNTELSTDTCHSGTKSMKMTIIGNDGGNNSAGAQVEQLTLDYEWLDGVTLYYR